MRPACVSSPKSAKICELPKVFLAKRRNICVSPTLAVLDAAVGHIGPIGHIGRRLTPLCTAPFHRPAGALLHLLNLLNLLTRVVGASAPFGTSQTCRGCRGKWKFGSLDAWKFGFLVVQLFRLSVLRFLVSVLQGAKAPFPCRGVGQRPTSQSANQPISQSAGRQRRPFGLIAAKGGGPGFNLCGSSKPPNLQTSKLPLCVLPREPAPNRLQSA